MKSKGNYQIHALISSCHLHAKKRAPYSIALKIGPKAIANTQYKMPIDDQIDFNTELILKIDKALYQGPAKLSIIVTMLTEEKQKKIIGSIFANYKQKGLQTYRVSACACKDKGNEVNVQFEVVNIQNHNNNPHSNNKIQSGNKQQMKDLKKALTISRQKQLVKSSRVKQNIGTKSPVQKTQAKVNKQKIEKQLKQQLNNDISSLTTKISPSSNKLNQQTKQLVNQLKNKILDLQSKLRQTSFRQKTIRKQLTQIYGQVQIMRCEKQCLIQILKFEQQKSSAAISYIGYLVQKIGQKQLVNNNLNQFKSIIKRISIQNNNDTSQAIKQHNSKLPIIKPQQPINEYKTIQEKQQINEQNNSKLLQQIQSYKHTIYELKHKIAQYQSQQTQKNENINYLQSQISKITKQNSGLKQQKSQFHKEMNDYLLQIKSLNDQNYNLDKKIIELQKSLAQINHKQIKSTQQFQQINKLYNSTLKQNAQLKQKLLNQQKNIHKLKQLQNKYDQLNKSYQQFKSNNRPKTPQQSQIILKNSRFNDGQEIQNIINQMNACTSKKKNLKSKQLLISSRRNDDDEDRFMNRNKSQSLLKDLQQASQPDSENHRTQQSNDIYKPSYKNKDQTTTKSSKKISIPQHKKQVQKYNYEYDVDSLNYFNNFEQNHEMENSGVQQNNNSCEIQGDFHGKA